MKYIEQNKCLEPEYVNTFRLHPGDGEIVMDFARIDYAETRQKAELDGRDRPEEIFLCTKARIIIQPSLALKISKAISEMIKIEEPKKEDSEPITNKEV
ncbi:MAG: hypothetical protein II961_00370 [Candidatus Riflebacteria bacterium]|nr:hypothetical protein [Candidatus Riflebacteria bacterium]